MAPWPILSIVTFLPLLGAVLIMFLPQTDAGVRNSRWTALWTSAITFVVSLFVLVYYDPHNPGFQLIERAEWIPGTGIIYQKGVDGISLWFVLVSTFLTPVCIISAWSAIKTRVREFMIAFLVLETMMVGMFSALDIILLYVFFEGVLIPMFLIIGIWGGPRRVYAAFKFFLYTLFGSVLMLLAILAMYLTTGTTDLIVILHSQFSRELQIWMWLAYFASFAVKMPMWPVHTWLPDAHVEAPTAGSVILAAVLLKMGGYGFIRFSVQMLPDASLYFQPFMFTLSIVAIIYTSLVALVQTDMKKLIAYSSVAHMGFVTLGIFTLNQQGIDGAVFQMLSHAIVSGALFLCVGVVYDRLHTRDIARYGGMARTMPKYALVFAVFMLASVGLPGTSGFVGEFLALVGTFEVNRWAAFFATTGIILGAAYMLVLYRSLFYGEVTKDDVRAMPDLNWREMTIFAPLIALTLWMGIYPSSFKDLIDPSVAQIVQHQEQETGHAARTASMDGQVLPAAQVEASPMIAAVPDFSLALPEIVFAGLALVLLMVGTFGKEKSMGLVTALSAVSCIVAIVLVLITDTATATGFEGLFIVDRFAGYMKVLVLLGSALSIIMSAGYMRRERMLRPEFPVLILLATVGMMLMISANNIISLYVGLELQSLALYVLAAFHRDTIRSAEAGLKYFVLGALASGVLLYGATLVYGFTGTTSFEKLAVLHATAGVQTVGLWVGMALVASGLIFKVSAVPFHMWTPDVYEGAPTPVTAMFAVAPKIAAMALLVRLLIGAFGPLVHQWQIAILAISVMSMAWGGYAAIVQRNIKRLMAYSSIANVGYILLGLAAGTERGVESVLIYLVIYLFMTAGAFAVILAMRRDGHMVEQLSDLAGLSQNRPMLALAMTVFMFSLGGIPPLAGFIGKLYVFQAALQAGNQAASADIANAFYVAAGLGAAISVVSMFYYLWIIKIMYIDPPGKPLDGPAGAGLSGVLLVTVLFTLLFPLTYVVGPVVGWADAAAQSLTLVSLPTR